MILVYRHLLSCCYRHAAAAAVVPCLMRIKNDTRPDMGYHQEKIQERVYAELYTTAGCAKQKGSSSFPFISYDTILVMFLYKYLGTKVRSTKYLIPSSYIWIISCLASKYFQVLIVFRVFIMLLLLSFFNINKNRQYYGIRNTEYSVLRTISSLRFCSSVWLGSWIE